MTAAADLDALFAPALNAYGDRLLTESRSAR